MSSTVSLCFPFSLSGLFAEGKDRTVVFKKKGDIWVILSCFINIFYLYVLKIIGISMLWRTFTAVDDLKIIQVVLIILCIKE